MNTNTAAAVRAELKSSFPSMKFSVRSERDTVRVSYTNGLPTADVEKVLAKFERGTFDGMTDSYVYSNVREDVPQCRYLFVDRAITTEKREEVKAQICKEYGMDVNSDIFTVTPTGEYLNTMIHRLMWNMTI